MALTTRQATGNYSRIGSGLNPNSNYEQQLIELLKSRGVKPPAPPQEKRGALETLSRIANKITATEAGFVRGVMNPQKYGGVASSIKQAWDKNIGFGDVLRDDFGWKPTGLGGRAGQLAVSLALDVGLDPVTYLSFGTIGAGKVGAKTAAQLGTKYASKVAGKTFTKVAENKLAGMVGKGIDYDLARRFLAKKGAEGAEDIFAKSGITFGVGSSRVLIPGSEKIMPALKASKAFQTVKKSPLGEFAINTSDNFKGLFNRDAKYTKNLPRNKLTGESMQEFDQARITLTETQKVKNVENLVAIQKNIGVTDLDAKEYFWARAKEEFMNSTYKTNKTLTKHFDNVKPMRELSPSVQKFDKVVRQYFDTIFERDQQAGHLYEGLPNYLTQIWKNGEKAKALNNTMFKIAKNQITRFGKHRVFSDVLEGMAKGLEPEDNVLKLMYARKTSSDIAKINQDYILNAMKGWADIKVVPKLNDGIKSAAYALGDGLMEVSNIGGLKKTPELVQFLEGIKKPAIGDLKLSKKMSETGEKYYNKKLVEIQKVVAQKELLEKKLLSVPTTQVYGRRVGEEGIQHMLPVDDIAKIPTGKQVTRQRGGKVSVTTPATRPTKQSNIIRAPKKGAYPARSGLVAVKSAINYKTQTLKRLTNELDSIAKSYKKPLEEIRVTLPQVMAESMMVDNMKYINDKAFNALLDGFDKMQGFFKGGVTSYFPAFHARNAISNVVLSAMDIGLAAINPVKKAEVWAVKAGGKGFLKTKFGTEIAYDNVRKIAKELDVLGGFTAKDIYANKGMDISKVFGPGRKLGEFIESEARLSHFMEGLRRGLDPVEAAQRTKDFLFDYGNLSEFEKTVMRRIFPFYTFSRKNIGLHLKMLKEKPGFIAGELKAGLEMRPGTEEERAKLQFLPDYLKEGFTLGVGDMSGDDIRIISKLGTPIEEFTDKLSIKGWINLLSPAVKYPFEKATGQSLFTGKPFAEDTNGTFAKDMPNIIKNYLGYREAVHVNKNTEEKWTQYTVDPSKKKFFYGLIVSRITSTASNLLDKKAPILDKASNFLTGLKVRNISTKGQQSSIEKQRLRELEILLERLGEGYSFSKFVIPKEE